MMFSEAHGYKVVSTSTAETVGKVDELVVDPRSRSVVALGLKKTDTGQSLRWGDLAAFGSDAVTVASADLITEPTADIAALTGKDHHLIGKRVLDTRGDELGKVDDVEFDQQSGEVTGVLIAHDKLQGARLIGVGSYAVVVHAV
jgi:sporulation protein YlmC with PRC-barrel domain